MATKFQNDTTTKADDWGYLIYMATMGALTLAPCFILWRALEISNKNGDTETTKTIVTLVGGALGGIGFSIGVGALSASANQARNNSAKDVLAPEPTPEPTPPTFSSPVEPVSIDSPGGDTGYAHMGFQVPSVAGDTGCLKATLYGMEVNFIP